MSARNLSARQPAKNIGSSPPTRKVMGPDGVMVTEKLAPLAGKKMVSPDGDVVHVVLTTGYTIPIRGNPHAAQKLEEKFRAGFLPFAECPVAKGYLKGTDPCAGSDGRGQFSDQECCPHIAKVMEARRSKHREEQIAKDRSFHTQLDKLIELQQKQLAQAATPAAPERKARIGG